MAGSNLARGRTAGQLTRQVKSGYIMQVGAGGQARDGGRQDFSTVQTGRIVSVNGGRFTMPVGNRTGAIVRLNG